MTPTALPKQVRRYYGYLQEVLEIEPEAELLPSGAWRLSSANDRVRVTFDFARTRTGATSKFYESTLSVDGEPHELAHDWEQLKEIFDNPDGKRDLGPLPEPVPVEEAPPQIRSDYAIFDGKLGEDVRLGLDDKGQWVIAFTVETSQVRVHYHRHGKGPYHQEIELVRDGEDLTHLVRGGMGALLALLSGGGGAAPEQPPTQGAPVRAARSNSVETRRATVIRN